MSGGDTSEITLAEVLVKPLEAGGDDLVAAYEQMIVTGPNFEVCPVERAILGAAARVRAGRKSIRLPDAIHIATAGRLSCIFFVSGDMRLHLPAAMRVLLNPFTLDNILSGRR